MSRGTIFISTGCVSADRVTAPVLRELRAHGVHDRFVGLVGDLLVEEGVESLADLNRLSTIGLIGSWASAARHLDAIHRVYRRLVALFARERPRLAILVDNPGQNLLLMRLARRHRIPVLYYVTPQDVWAVGLGQAKTLANGADQIANVFEFEPPYFLRYGGRAEWVGHPLVDILDSVSRPKLAGQTVALFPGSRLQEVRDLTPLLRGAAARLHREHAGLRFIISAATQEIHSLLDAEVEAWPMPVEVYNHEPYRALSQADLLIACSGTATLEATLLGLPHVVVYRVHNVLDRVLRPLVVRLGHLAMPNLLAGRAIVPELIGRGATGETIFRHAAALLGDTPERRRMLADLEETRGRLGGGGAIARTAEMAVSLLDK